MSRHSIILVLATLAVAPVPLSRPAWASSPDAGFMPTAAPTVPSPAPAWSGHPPEDVRTAAAALHDACTAWPKQVRLATELPRPLDRDASEHARACNFALDPDNYAFSTMLEGGVFGAAAAGLAAVSFAVAKIMMWWLLEALARGFAALWNRHCHRLQRLTEQGRLRPRA